MAETPKTGGRYLRDPSTGKLTRADEPRALIAAAAHEPAPTPAAEPPETASADTGRSSAKRK